MDPQFKTTLFKSQLYVCMWTHTLEYYSAFKIKEILSFVITWKLEGFTISEVSQAEKNKYCIASQREEKWSQGKKNIVKGYKLSVVRLIRSEDLMYNVVTIADNTIV